MLAPMEWLALDGDSALPGILSARDDAQHLARAGDPGHLKKNFIRSLKKLFGQKKVFACMAEKFGRFYMWSAKKAIALFPGSYLDAQVKANRRAEFKRRFGHCLDHYTNEACLPTCPCHEAGAAIEERTSLDLLEQAILEALQESPAEGEAVVVEPDGEPAIVAAEALGDEEEKEAGGSDDEIEEGEGEVDSSIVAFAVSVDGDEEGEEEEDDEVEVEMDEDDYDFEEEEQRPPKKRRVEVAEDPGEKKSLVLGIDETAQRIPCHHDKKWLDPSLPAVAAIAAEMKAIVVRVSSCLC